MAGAEAEEAEAAAIGGAAAESMTVGAGRTELAAAPCSRALSIHQSVRSSIASRSRSKRNAKSLAL